MIEINDLTVRYGDTVAVDRLTLSMPTGRIYGLLGRNGSGKTSLLSVLASYRRASSGSITIDGVDPFENPEMMARTAFIRDTLDANDQEKVFRILCFAGWIRPGWDAAYAERLLDVFELHPRKRISALSRGQRSSFGVVLGLAARAELTILDEVYLGMFRIYRPVVLWFLGIMVGGTAVADVVIARYLEPGFSVWLFAGSVGRYWLMVVGILLATMHLRQYVSNGVTRRDFLTGAAVFGLILAVFFALLVPVGHGIESALLGLDGRLGAGYPPFSFAVAVREFGSALPAALAFGVSGIAVSAGFYRYGTWGGFLILLPAVLPIAATQAFLGIDEHGRLSARFVPYAVALTISLAVTALAAVLYHRTLRDVPIRRTAG